MAVSIILASMWFFIIPSAHVLASEVLNANDWLRTLGPNDITVISALYEMITAIILGHNYDSLILPYRVSKFIGLTNVAQSFNSPIWTLHIEFYGSMLVLLLVELEIKLKRNWHRFVCGAIMVVLFFHPLELFVVGYVLANLISKPIYLSYCETLLAKFFGISLLIFGIILASVKAPLWFINIFSFLIIFKKIPFFLNADSLYGQIGAILFFTGVLSLSELQNFLSNRFGSVLGRYSFSLYLVHFPILVTVTSLIFVILSQYNIAYALMISFILSFILTGITTFLFERFVERPSIELSRAIRFGESK